MEAGEQVARVVRVLELIAVGVGEQCYAVGGVISKAGPVADKLALEGIRHALDLPLDSRARIVGKVGFARKISDVCDLTLGVGCGAGGAISKIQSGLGGVVEVLDLEGLGAPVLIVF